MNQKINMHYLYLKQLIIKTEELAFIYSGWYQVYIVIE